MKQRALLAIAACCLAACASRPAQTTTAERQTSPEELQTKPESDEGQPAAGSADASAKPGQPGASMPALPELPPRQELPLEAREALGLRMERHAEQMTYLMALVVLLRFDDVVELAEMIAREPKLGRPAPHEKGTLNALLPQAFFDRQDELEVRARKLAEAARGNDEGKIVQAFSALTETCVRCHATYLQDQAPSVGEHDPL